MSQNFRQAAIAALYETIYIPDTMRLRLLLQTIEDDEQSGKGQFVRKLSINLGMCWGKISKQRSPEVCDQLYRLLNKTESLELLSLDLRECTNCCFRIIGPEQYAANGANGKKLSIYCVSFTTWPLPGSSVSLWGLYQSPMHLLFASQNKNIY